MLVKEAKAITGGLGKPSKMPGRSYGISAHKCITGSKLAEVEGSVCHGCYALKGHYLHASVAMAHANRLDSWASPQWPSAMAMQILRSKTKEFRWHDSGDIQSVDHLRAIVQVCNLTRKVKHWIPTRELKLIQDYVAQYGPEPSNLCIRVSATMVDGPATKAWPQTSGVYQKRKAIGWQCVAPKHDNTCGPCRKCWDKNTPHVEYHKH